jgi:membrane-associated phospholipid phosphatase
MLIRQYVALAREIAGMSVAAAHPQIDAAPSLRTLPARLTVPTEFAAKLDAAIRAGAADARAFASEHASSERSLITEWALLRMKFPPKDDSEDLAYLHAIARSRTPAGIEAARYWAKHGLLEEWERMLEAYTSRVGPREARAARKLLHDALMMTNMATQVGKAASNRKRPFIVDESIPLVLPRPGGNPSYPSGHASAAFAACMVLAKLMPHRSAEFMQLAREASFARVYGGVHFPTDVIAGAQLASTVVTYLNRVSGTKPLGRDGARMALGGAALLLQHRSRLANAGMLSAS